MNETHNNEAISRLNLVLRTLQKINQLVIREKDRTRLLKGICHNLVENQAYYNVWIVLLDETNKLITSAEAGLGKEFFKMVEQLIHGDLAQCQRKAIVKDGVVLTKNPASTCKNCPLSGKYAGRDGMTIRLQSNGKVHGLMCASISPEILAEEERVLFQEIANNVALALNKIELDEASKKNKHSLNERLKELNCLYSISSLIEKQSLSLEEILQGIVDFIPPAFQYPEIASAKIAIKDQEFKTANFQETVWRHDENIIVKGEPYGVLTVCFLEELPEIEEDPFLIEERALIHAISERIGKVFERKQAQQFLLESEKRFRDLVENSLVGISIIQDDQIVYNNPEQIRLLGGLAEGYEFTENINIHPEDVEKTKQLFQNLSYGKSKKLDIDFRFYPENEGNHQPGMRWVQCRASVIEYQGKESILVNMMDVTRAKELEKLLVVQDKMASLGRVAAGIAHEIRNPLSGINIYINTLNKLYKKGERPENIQDIFSQLQSASKKIESVIRRVMDFSKPNEPNFVLASINRPIEEAIKLTAVTLKKSGVAIDSALAPGLQKCQMDPHMIEAVIFNLITNAADAMKNMKGPRCIKVTSAGSDCSISVKVSDSGPGVPQNLREKIFDPFYTTKPDSTGIGLSICHRMIRDHDGTIRVDSSQWGGAQFYIEIPVEKRD